MPSLETLSVLTLAALLMNISPGPSNFYIMSRSIAQGTTGGMMAVIGLTLGGLCFVITTAIGLSQLFLQYPTLYMLLKLFGACYLLYLGIQAIRTQVQQLHLPKVSAVKSNVAIVKESFIVEITNPKTALFYITFLPQFVQPEVGPIGLQLLILGSVVALSAIPCDLLVAFFSSKAATWISNNLRAQQIQGYLSGGILIGLAIYVLFSADYF